MKAVILAGGGGTRLWPLSTPERPKQFQKLVSNKTMLEETVERLDFLKPEDIFIAINEKHLELTKELCPEIPAKNIIVEPALRDTASCIALAAAIIEKKQPEEVMCVIYADHLIQNKKEFQKKLQLAAKIALEKNTLNIVEVVAKDPNTNYGYVKLGPPDPNSGPDVYFLEKFVEKPDRVTAEQFLKEGNYLWNTGIYVWKASTLLNHYQKFQPETYEKIRAMQQDESKISELYPQLEKISIDYAIMEKVAPQEIRIIKADLAWSDIGNWEAIWKELKQKPEDNVTLGEVESSDCQSCLIYAQNRKKVAAIGLKEMVIVDSPNGLLVCTKSDSKRVKELQQKN